MRTGFIDPNRALDPGLIYDIGRQNYVNLLCSLHFSTNELFAITKSDNLDCSNPSTDLNYPSLIVLYDDCETGRTQKFRRIVTNVGNDVTAYKAIVKAPEDSEVRVSPNILVFRKINQKHFYDLEMEYKGNEKGKICFGTLVWEDENRKHTVQTPEPHSRVTCCGVHHPRQQSTILVFTLLKRLRNRTSHMVF